MAGYWTTDSSGKPVFVDPDKTTGRDLDKDVLTKAKLQDTTGLGRLGNAGPAGKGAGPMPKQEAGEDPAAYGKRLREWREKAASAPAPTAAGQADSLRRKKE